MELNPEQKEAVEHFEGPLLVLAGAGSGKTRVLTTRIANLIREQGVDPAAILAVTFTNKAAGEMRERVRRQLGHEPAGLWIGTFHAIGARLLRRHAHRLGWSPNFSIFDADQALREVKRALERLNLPVKRWPPKAVHASISGAKNGLVSPEEYAALAGDPFTRVVADVFPAYEKALKEQNAFDFDDLLVKPVELFERHADILEEYRRRFQFVLVDEYQDTNRAQYRFLQLLAEEHANLMVVGDDDQSIYGWRGADIRNILDFEKDFPATKVIRLEQNYRSTSRILEAANQVIAENVRRKGKTLRTQAGPGEPLTRLEALDENDEAAWIVAEIEARMAESPDRSPRDFTVLYRTNAQSRALEEALRRRDIPYQIVGGIRFYERREIMDVLAYLRLVSNPRDAGAFDRIVNYPKRGIGDTTLARLLTWAAEQGVTPLAAAARAREVESITTGAASALVAFSELIGRYRALALHLGVGELLERLLEETGFVEALREEGPEGEERIDNVRELVAGAHEFDELPPEADDDAEATPLDLFLQKVSLLTDVDRQDPEANRVTLMTLHNAKGLEFPFVFISGLEDGLFPLARAYDEPEQLEEERRLFYVGITRARRKVYLTHARTRRRAGEVLSCIPSSFLQPIAPELLESRITPVLASSRRQLEDRWRATSSLRPARRTSAPTAGADAGVVIDYSEAQDAPRFIKGERVRHPHFGRGTIKELSGFGAEMKAVIEFESVGRKKVVLRYANLQKEL
ncbi:MAG TPA: UvrD-helicase domain-containing protein [Longimicrobiales bacterium]|nr:UvrD-helicase domain-containing protein [Longimicrobiales bacterium]